MHPEVNQELEQLLNTILERFVRTWYDELNVFSLSDQRFEREIRVVLKHLTAVCIKRLRSVNVKKTIQTKLIPALIQHLHIYLNGKRSARAQQFIERAVLKEYYDAGVFQPQMRSEAEESKWLRNLSELLLPLLVPPKALHSNLARTLLREIISCGVLKPIISIVSDPFYVNDIFSIVFDADSPSIDLDALQKANEGNAKLVALLINFDQVHGAKSTSTASTASKTIESAFDYKTCFGVELNALIKDQQMLFLLLRFLKEEGCVNYLQFILTIDGFNEKILNPELSDDDRNELYVDAVQICRSYFVPSGIDYIECLDESWANELQTVLDQGPSEIDQLRKIGTLFEAYERVYSCLENEYLPMFFESDLYVKLIVGSRTHLNSVSSERLSYGNELGLVSGEEYDASDTKSNESTSDEESDIGANTKDGKNNDEFIFDYGIDLLDLIERSDLPNDEQQRQFCELKDLSTWQVKIEKVETKVEHNSFKYYYVYVLRVTQSEPLFDDAYSVTEGMLAEETNSTATGHYSNIDESGESKSNSIFTWLVERKYDEFYVLDDKLKKFHGNAHDSIASLSPKRTLFKQSLAFLEGRRRQFEKYIQALLKLPRFQRSELLYNFLKPAVSQKQADIFNSRMVGINIKKMIKTMPAKFSQEKGQHLDAFLNNLIGSTEAQKVRGNVPDLKDIFNYVEESNAPSSDSESAGFSPQATFFGPFTSTSNVHLDVRNGHYSSQWIYDYFTFFVTRICLTRSLGSICAFLLRIFQPLLKPTVNHWFDLLLDRKMCEFLTVANIRYALQQLRLSLTTIDLTQSEPAPARYSHLDAKCKYKQSLDNMQKYFARITEYVPGLTAPQNTVYFVHSVFQHQKLNKQLIYLLISLLLEDFFPEICETNH